MRKKLPEITEKPTKNSIGQQFSPTHLHFRAARNYELLHITFHRA